MSAMSGGGDLCAFRPLGLILAGGEARRMGGGDKTLKRLGHDTLLATLAGRLQPQCTALAISANGDAARFAHTSLRVVPDQISASIGPLAGVLAGLTVCHEAAGWPWLLTVPGDTPFVPSDLVARFRRGIVDETTRIVRACSGGRAHPLVALWSLAVRTPLHEAIRTRDMRSVKTFQAEMQTVDVVWPIAPYDPFFNINTPEDLTKARATHDRFL